MSSSPPTPRVFEAKDVTLTHIATNSPVPISSLYSPTSPLVLVFLRRWGCSLCRGYAQLLQTSLLPSLTLSHVNVAAVGFEREGVEGFGPYFPPASLYLDPERRAYAALHLQRLPMLTGLMALLSSTTRAWNAQVSAMGVTGNFKGDGMQLGGTYIIGAGGEVWFEHVQKEFGDHPTVEQLLQVLEARVPGFVRAGKGEGEERKDGGGVAASTTPKSKSTAASTEVVSGEATATASPVVKPRRGLEKIGAGGPTCDEDCQ